MLNEAPSVKNVRCLEFSYYKSDKVRIIKYNRNNSEDRGMSGFVLFTTKNKNS